MHKLLSAMGRAFLRAFATGLLTYGIGILAAPGLHKAYLLGVAALLGSVAAGIRAVQAYVPQLTVSHYLVQPWGAYADSFLHAFLAALAISLPGVLGAPDLNTGRALGLAAIVGALNAGVRALQGLFTNGESPAPATGISDPKPVAMPAPASKAK